MSGAAPSVSVVIPSCDSAPHAAAAVESVLAQTFRDFEIVLVDDGSGAADAAALDDLAAKPGVRLLRRERSGAARARRAGWELARGAYVALLDDDDRYRREYLARCVAQLDAHEGHAAVYTAYEIVNPEGEVQRRLPARGASGRIFATEVRKSSVKTSTLMVRREALDSLTGLQEHHRTSQNYDMILRLAYHHAFYFIDEPLVEIVDRPGSLSKDISRRHRSRAEILMTLLRAHPEMAPGERRAVRRKIGKYYRKAARGRRRREGLRPALPLYVASFTSRFAAR